MHEIITNITMIIVGIIFTGISIASYVIEPGIMTTLMVIGSILMIVAACYILVITVRA